MNREQFYTLMGGEGTLDYELYLNTKALLSCQTKFEELCNADELQFQIVHQVEVRSRIVQFRIRLLDKEFARDAFLRLRRLERDLVLARRFDQEAR